MTEYDKMDRTTHWQKALIREGDIFGFCTRDGWLVSRAILTEVVPYQYDRWASIPGGNAAGPFAGSAIPDAPRDVNAKNIIYHEYEDQMWQCFTGVSIPLSYVFFEYPLRERHGGIRSDIGNPSVQATTISPFGWKFSGWESFIGRETSASMFMLPYKTDVGIAIYNVASYAFTPKTRFLFNKVKFDPLDPMDKKDASIITDFLKCRIEKRAVRWSAGTDTFSYSPGFQSIFKVYPVTLTKRQIYVQTGAGAVPIEEAV